jgi:hypothetical protein
MQSAMSHRSRCYSSRARVAVGVVAGAALLSACVPTKVGIFVPRQEAARDIVAEADYLGVQYLRMEQQLDEPLNGYIKTFVAAAKQVNLVAKVGTGTTSTPPDDVNVYKANLSARLDEYRTPLLAVENEETANNFYAGTADQYLAQLRAAVEVAHAKQVKVTNGGIPFVITALITWNHIRKTRGTAAADTYINEAFDTSARQLNQLAAGLTGYPANAVDPYDDPSLPLPANVRDNWRDGEYLLSKYGKDPGDVDVDYVNFHWYVTDETDYSPGDTQALRDTIDYFQQSTGKSAVTNEVGQYGLNAGAVTATLDVLGPEKKLSWALWFDHDGSPARALHNYDPNDFDAARDARPNGRAFRQRVSSWKTP